MGFADLLFLLGIPYSSKEAVHLGGRLMEFIQAQAVQASEDLAKERGAFGNFAQSVFNDPESPTYNGGAARRNATVTTIAPTGTISIIAGCSSGIEPLFAICFYRRVLDGAELIEAHPLFEQVARSRGFYSESLMKEIAIRGSCQEMQEIPEDVRRVFVTSHDIAPIWHLEHQAAFQRFCENAVSKTVNFPNSATREDVAEVYRLAYLKGCKGVTIYRDGSRDVQVLNIGLGTGNKKSNESPAPVEPASLPKPAEHPRPVPAEPAKVGRLESAKLPNRADSRVLRRVTLSAGNTKVAINSLSTNVVLTPPDSADAGDRLMRQFQANVDRQKFERLTSDNKLFLSDGNGFRVPLYLVSQQGTPKRGVQLLINAESSIPSVSTQHAPKCPECGFPIQMVEGCQTCRSCGYSKCG
jgi:ribonucleoside-diphosphate reductase alpha chain